MAERLLGVLAGTTLILLILLWRGLPVLFFLKILPALGVLALAILLITAGLTDD